MQPTPDPDLLPTTSGSPELRYYDTTDGILLSCRLTGKCLNVSVSSLQPMFPGSYPGTDPRLLPAAATLGDSLAAWCTTHNLTLVTNSTHPVSYSFLAK